MDADVVVPVDLRSRLPSQRETGRGEVLLLRHVSAYASSSGSRSSAPRRPLGRKGGVALPGWAARPEARLAQPPVAGWPGRCPALAGTWRCLPAHCAPAPAAPFQLEPAQEWL